MVRVEINCKDPKLDLFYVLWAIFICIIRFPSFEYQNDIIYAKHLIDKKCFEFLH